MIREYKSVIRLHRKHCDLFKRTVNLPESDTAKNKVVNLQCETGNVAMPARVPRVMENNRIQYIIVKDGDTREKLEKEFQLLKWELPKYNELSSDFQLVPGQILYLQPKRDKAEPGKEFHNTVERRYNVSDFAAIWNKT